MAVRRLFSLCALLLLGSTAGCGKKSTGSAAPASSEPAPGAHASSGAKVDGGAQQAPPAGNSAQAPASKPIPGLGTWVKRLGSKQPDGDVESGYLDPEVGRLVAVDAEGNVLLVASFRGTADFGGGPLTSAGDTDLVLAQYDRTGTHRWSRRFGGAAAESAEDLALDPQGNIYLAGSFWGTVDFGGGPMAEGGFVVKLDARGNHLWSRPVQKGRVKGVAVTPEGEVVVAGPFKGEVVVGSEKVTGVGEQSSFLARLDAEGRGKWIKAFGGAKSSVYAKAVRVHTDGSVYLAAEIKKTVDFGGGPLTSAGSSDIALVKLDAGGGHLWSKSFGAEFEDRASRIALDTSGAMVVVGDFIKPIDFGGGKLVSRGDVEAFVAKFDAGGGHVWSRRFGGTEKDAIHGVAIDPQGYVAITGDFPGEAGFDGQAPLVSAGDREKLTRDTFISLLDPKGTPVWSRRLGGPRSEWGTDVAMDRAGAVVATGGFEGKATYQDGDLTSIGGNDIYLVTIAK
jgi:hypothetical protein